MTVFLSTIAALVVLGVFTYVMFLQNRDLLRARAYREFFVRMIPSLSTAVFIAGLPLILNLASVDTYGNTLFVYLAGAAILTALTARAVAPDERRAGRAFRAGDYERAISSYEAMISSRPLPRYYSALAACLDASGNPQSALEAAEMAVKQDPKLGIAYFNRASANAAVGETARARGDLQMVFQTDSNRQLRKAAGDAMETLEKL